MQLRPRCTFLICLQLAVASTLFQASNIPAQELASDPISNSTPQESAHWAFASLFGTGWYQLEENRSVFVVNVRPRIELQSTRPPGTDSAAASSHSNLVSDDVSNAGAWGIELLLPLTLGLHSIDSLPGFIEAQNFGTASFTPGLELEIPLNEDWTLRPYAQLGYGKDFTDGDSAWIVMGGIKARYRVEGTHARWDWLARSFAGAFKEDNIPSDQLTGLQLGFERRGYQPITAFGHDLQWVWSSSYTNMSRPLGYVEERSGAFETLDAFFDVAVALSPVQGPWSLGIYQPEQLGIALEVGADGDYFGVKLYSSSWFLR